MEYGGSIQFDKKIDSFEAIVTLFFMFVERLI